MSGHFLTRIPWNFTAEHFFRSRSYDEILPNVMNKVGPVYMEVGDPR